MWQHGFRPGITVKSLAVSTYIAHLCDHFAAAIVSTLFLCSRCLIPPLLLARFNRTFHGPSPHNFYFRFLCGDMPLKYRGMLRINPLAAATTPVL